MDAEQSLPVVFSNLGISEVASSFRTGSPSDIPLV